MSTRPKPSVDRLVETAIYVDDIASTGDFYDTVFGFPALVRDDRVVAYDAGASSVFLLFKRGGTLKEVVLAGGTIPPHDGAGPSHFCFAIDAEQLDDWEAHLAALNIPVEARMNWDQGGKSLYFRDPDGHLIELGTPGIWRTY